ncbi:hypothetical protein SKAU_G00309480 [Synaphobranchus kaupii]|uniref:Uncharacterized protein n=1 Tax=Synaphobranchus kaupii TaxID=118154 RepID=A0A9Q1ERK5_SYNKA|nr:hypothetical protein SKAU_G00309480 [Synaphobranchus kaupii]
MKLAPSVPSPWGVAYILALTAERYYLVCACLRQHGALEESLSSLREGMRDGGLTRPGNLAPSLSPKLLRVSSQRIQAGWRHVKSKPMSCGLGTGSEDVIQQFFCSSQTVRGRTGRRSNTAELQSGSNDSASISRCDDGSSFSEGSASIPPQRSFLLFHALPPKPAVP